MFNTIITRRKSTVLKKSVILHRQIAEEMKYRTVFLLVALVVSVLSVACNNKAAKGTEEVFAKVEKPDDYEEWDRQYWDSTNHYLLLVKWIGDTTIRFDYRVFDSLGNYRYVGGTAVNKYGWLACEFIESGDTLIPADEYLWEDSVSYGVWFEKDSYKDTTYRGSLSLGIRIGLNDSLRATVRSDNERWSSPMLSHVEPQYP